MARRVSRSLLANGTHRAIGHVLDHIGTTWPIEEREEVLSIVMRAMFPPCTRADVWRGYDQTFRTVGQEFYYPIPINLEASPSSWFKNLRLLQLRVKLNLVQSLRISINSCSLISGEVIVKLKGLEQAVGKEIMERHRVPRFLKPRMMTTRNRIANERAQGLREAGLLARARRS